MNEVNHSSNELEAQLEQYVDTYDEISKFLNTETDEHKRRMAVAHRKHVLDMMLTLRLKVGYPKTA